MPAAKPRVVPILVQFVGSDGTPAEAARSVAAATILRVLRGHLMRKNVRVVSRIDAAVGEIERWIREEEEQL